MHKFVIFNYLTVIETSLEVAGLKPALGDIYIVGKAMTQATESNFTLKDFDFKFFDLKPLM